MTGLATSADGAIPIDGAVEPPAVAKLRRILSQMCPAALAGQAEKETA